MAPPQSSNREPAAPNRPLRVDCLDCVLRAGRQITTTRLPSGAQRLVAPNDAHQSATGLLRCGVVHLGLISHRVDEPADEPVQIEKRRGRGFGASPEEIDVPARKIMLSEDLAKPPAQSIANHGVPDPTRNCERNRGVWGLGRDSGHRERPAPPATTLRELHEGRMALDSSNQAERRARPLRRRDFTTARPPRVRIRSRNPCFFDRLRLLGWNVRFNGASSSDACTRSDRSQGSAAHA